ncbi:ABC transporter ATP-binding protein [Lujinxingia vulgaris]|uniref:ABC transporter ATP-binding protein n=2 Tax=Lujinxingia vulgaris TaxID=2600176 RepID=A0A5C6XKC7_9DELT|nr:ABC transporter ATP-binding protein [Lujinxingia vulgaris]
MAHRARRLARRARFARARHGACRGAAPAAPDPHPRALAARRRHPDTRRAGRPLAPRRAGGERHPHRRSPRSALPVLLTRRPRPEPRMTAPTPALVLENLTKRYRRLVAVNQVNLSIAPGEFVALIGPNGAGKSSTMGCVAGITAPDEGSVHINGVDVVANPVEARKHLGFVPQHLAMLDYLTGLEYLHFVAELRELPAAQRDAEIEELLAITELEDARHVVLKEYSGGMARKLAIASVLLGSPKLLVLDESFVGLDPESTARLRTRLQRHCDQGGAILLSSHILDMLERLCSRFVLLQGGELAMDISRAELDRKMKSGEVRDLTELYLKTTGKIDLIGNINP